MRRFMYKALAVGDGLLVLIGLTAAGVTVWALMYFWPTVAGFCMDIVAAVGFEFYIAQCFVSQKCTSGSPALWQFVPGCKLETS